MNLTRKHVGYVYFILSEQSKSVKIGYSSTPEKRLDNLQTGSPVQLKLIGKLQATKSDEASFHAHYQEYRTHGEWFALPQDEIDAIVRDYGVEQRLPSRFYGRGRGMSPFQRRPLVRELVELELSDALCKVMSTGVLVPTVQPGGIWEFPDLRLCREHESVVVPNHPCLRCEAATQPAPVTAQGGLHA